MATVQGMTLDEARALMAEIKAAHPSWPLQLWLPDATGDFNVMAWTPIPHMFKSADEYRRTRPGGAA